MTRVKVCGITRLEDAALAVELGAWAVGFVFWAGSPRRVTPEKAAAITRQLPALVVPVGVFVNQPLEFVNAVTRTARLGAVQLHGDEADDYAAAVETRVIRAASVERCDPGWLAQLDGARLLLLDASDPVRRGGTGRTIDWDAAAAIARRRPTVLAGGLTPDNVADAVTRVRPAAVDVSSGVEHSPGIKDPARMRALFAAVGRVEVRG